MGPRARIACIDARAEDRTVLRSRLEAMYARHRRGLRFGMNLELYVSSREELFLAPAPDIFVIGSGMRVDAAHSLCLELQAAYPEIPILLFLKEDSYSLRILRRFESACEEVFSDDESELRVVHAFMKYSKSVSTARSAKILNFHAAKGGVGATSIVIAIADVLSQQGKRVALIDLSKSGVIPFYLSAERWESRAFAVAIRQNTGFSEELVEDCVLRTPSGLYVVLPPAGGSEIRDVWLHDSERLEMNVALLNHLSEQFDYILVDSAHSEGLLPFALSCRASNNILLTNNEAASVHLAGQFLADVANVPGEGRVSLLFNLSTKDGLYSQDMTEFLERYAGYSEQSLITSAVPHDGRARYWIGSGESFYRTAGSRTKVALEEITAQLAGLESRPTQASFMQRLLRFRATRPKQAPLSLPAPRTANGLIPASEKVESNDSLIIESLYTPPKAIDGEKAEVLRCGVWKQQ